MINYWLKFDEATIFHIRFHYFRLVGVWYKVLSEHTKLLHAIYNSQPINTNQIHITYARFFLASE